MVKHINQIEMLKCFFRVVILFSCISIIGQEHNSIPDSLMKLSYDDLFIKMNSSDETKLRLVYTNAFLNKAKIEKDTSNIITGFEILAVLQEVDESLASIDSVIKLTESKPNAFYPANAFLEKGNKYYKKSAFKESLDSYMESHRLSSEYSNKKLIYKSLQGIAIIKNRIGDYESAIKIHHKNIKYFKKDTLSFGKDDYLNTLFSLSVLSLRLNKIDSSNYYNKIGFRVSKKYNWVEKMNHFRLSEGVAKYHKKMYSSSIDSISKSLNILIENNDRPNLIYAYFYLAQSFFETDKEELAITNLKKVDSLYELTKFIEPDTRVAYRQLQNFYKSKNDDENQLFFLNKLISIDSVYYNNQSLISSKIIAEYDFPKLLSSKEELIIKLEKGRKLLYYLGALLIVLIGVVFLYYRKKHKNQLKRFEALVSGNTISVQKPIQKSDDIGVPPEIIENVILALEKFEINNNFIDSNITLASLAKKMNTNSNYLSKIINHTKDKNFTSYLNELRINYAIKKLKNDNSFRKYTISAIASEVGFKSAETFSKTFKSITKIYPSYFIKKLDS